MDKIFKIGNTEIDVRLKLVRITDTTVGRAYEPCWVSKDNLVDIFSECSESK